MLKIKNLNLDIFFKISLFIWVLFIPMKTSFYQISYVLMILLFLIYIFFYKKTTQFTEIIHEQKAILIAFSFIILGMTISNFISPISTFLSWKTEFHYIFRYLIMFLTLLLFYRERIFTKRFLVITIFISLLFQGIDGIFQAIYHFDFIKDYLGNLQQGLTGAVFNRNPFGMLMALGASLSIGFISDQKQIISKRTIPLGIFFMIFVFNLIFSYSRASWLFFISYLVVLLLLNYKRINKYTLLSILIFLSIIIIIFITNENLLLRFHSLIKEDSSHRFAIWAQTIETIKQKLFFGHGLMTFSNSVGKVNGIHFSGVHNSILEITLFLGLFGFIAYTNLLWKILKKILSNKNKIQLALFFGFLVITQFDESIIKGIVPLSSLTIFAFFIFSQDKKTDALQ